MVDTNTNDRNLLYSIESTAQGRPRPGIKKLCAPLHPSAMLQERHISYVTNDVL
jgi:hypothetical protein